MERNIININIGVLGHVDSGKTSIVKALSTSFATAALDKHPQSQERGITLDLGFSSFCIPLSSKMIEENIHLSTLHKALGEQGMLQFTLVDCPGHASLIKTIIGGSQIIDMIILVVDITKGFQSQTIECLVIGEITCNNLIVVLNKVDLIPINLQEEYISNVKNELRNRFENTKFKDPPMITISSAVGGEKIAGISNEKLPSSIETIGIETLTLAILQNLKLPKRSDDSSPFLFLIDHCFSIKGHGTILTGTVLHGKANVNSNIEIPNLLITKKIKSIQLFRKPVKAIIQGDRAAICVSNLDPQLIERGIAATPSSISPISTALCLLKKVRYFTLPCKSNSKFHITVGHSTVLANVIFFGNDDLKSFINESRIEFDWQKEYICQEELEGAVDSTSAKFGEEKPQWALLQFEKPIFVPIGSIAIGSRLDLETKDFCRIAFSGPIKVSLKDHELVKLNIIKWKVKEGRIFKITSKLNSCCKEAIGHNLVNERGSIESFLNLYIEVENNDLFDIGLITSAFGSDGKFKIKFMKGIPLSVGNKFILKWKKFVFDSSKIFNQSKMYDSFLAEAAESASLHLKDMKVESTSLHLDKSENKNDNSRRLGKVESFKIVDGNTIAIINGAFSMEDNIKAYIGSPACLNCSPNTVGELIGPFAKLGKCKIMVKSLHLNESSIGTTVEIKLNN